MLSLIGAMTWANAQSGEKELRNAYSHYGNGYYDKALRSIKSALQFEDTKNEAKTWLYYGNIALQISNSNNDYYKKMLPNAEMEAYNAYMQALTLDPNVNVPNMKPQTPKQGLVFVSNMLYQKAYTMLTQQNMDSAVIVAEMARKANGNVNTVFMYGFAAFHAKQYDITKKEFAILMKNKYKGQGVLPYRLLATVYQLDKDTAKTLQVVEETLKMFEGDSNYYVFASTAAIAYSWAGLEDKATEIMEDALNKNPNDITMLVNYGSSLIEHHKYDEAEKYLQRAIELEPNSYEVNYNMGSCYFNQYADMSKGLGDIDDDNEYDRLKNASEEVLKKSKPFLEKAQAINGNDYNTLYMLRQVYTRTNEYDKLNEINAKMKELKENN